MDKHLSALLSKSKAGTITAEEIEAIMAKLPADPAHDDLYTVLHILGRAMYRPARPLIERYLEYPTDPMISALSLQILCQFWGDTSRYLAFVERYSRGVAWDRADVLRLKAVTLAGE